MEKLGFDNKDYELYKDQSNYHCGDGTLVLGKLDSLVDGQDIEVILQIKSKNKKYQLSYPLKYLNGGSYDLENKEDLKQLKDIDQVRLLIKYENQKNNLYGNGCDFCSIGACRLR